MLRHLACFKVNQSVSLTYKEKSANVGLGVKNLIYEHNKLDVKLKYVHASTTKMNDISPQWWIRVLDLI